MRGSIPLFWSQDTSAVVPKPAINRTLALTVQVTTQMIMRPVPSLTHPFLCVYGYMCVYVLYVQ